MQCKAGGSIIDVVATIKGKSLRKATLYLDKHLRGQPLPKTDIPQADTANIALADHDLEGPLKAKFETIRDYPDEVNAPEEVFHTLGRIQDVYTTHTFHLYDGEQ